MVMSIMVLPDRIPNVGTRLITDSCRSATAGVPGKAMTGEDMVPTLELSSNFTTEQPRVTVTTLHLVHAFHL
jgi:hypothetical protein